VVIPNSILNLLSLRDPKQITCVFIHHTVMHKTADADDVRRVEPFYTIGYNSYVKCVDVENDLWVVQQGRPLNRIPAAQYGMNTQGYAISIGGNYQPGAVSWLDTVSPNALHAAAAQIILVKKKCPNLKYLLGHRDVATIKAKEGLNPGDYATSCPGENLYSRLDDLRKMVGLSKYPGL